jgi:hypothetical protein
MTQQFCVQYYPPEALDDPEFFRQFNPDGSLAMTGIPAGFADSGAYLTRPQIVFDMTEMLRYVVFRDRINEVKKESANKEVHRIPHPRRVRKQ